MEVLRAKYKLLMTGVSGEMVYSHWKCARAAEISGFDTTRSNNDGSIDYSNKSFVLFSSKISVHVLNKCKGYLSEYESEPVVEFEFVEGRILTLAH